MFVVDADDFMSENFEDTRKFIDFAIKAHPDFKITLFTIPGRISDKHCSIMQEQYKNIVQLAIHGHMHTWAESAKWSYKQALHSIQAALKTGYYVRGFKAPFWLAGIPLIRAVKTLNCWIAGNNDNYVQLYNIPPEVPVYIPWNGMIHGHVSKYASSIPGLYNRLNLINKDKPPKYIHDFLFIDEYIRSNK